MILRMVMTLNFCITGDGYGGLPQPTNLFYAIVERYSPHVVAEIFFGHNHDDVVSVYYSNNGTNPSAKTALTTSWVSMIMKFISTYKGISNGFFFEIDRAISDPFVKLEFRI
jgi:hypothetical protein